MPAPSIAIVGGSFAGLATALALNKVLPQARITIIERRDTAKRKGATLTVAINALKALKAIDVNIYNDILSLAMPPRDYITIDEKGQEISRRDNQSISQLRQAQTDAYGMYQCISSWNKVQETLLTHLPPDLTYIQGQATNISEQGSGLLVHYTSVANQRQLHCDLLIAADGYHSQVRQCLPSQQGHEPTFKDRVFQWSRVSTSSLKDTGALQANMYFILNNLFYGNFFMPEADVVVITTSEPVDSLAARGYRFDQDSRQLLHTASGQRLGKAQLLQQQLRELPPFLQQYVAAVREEDIVQRGAYYHTPESWHPCCYGSGRVVFVGDSAHAFRPTGQGAAMAIEDAVCLAQIVREEGVGPGLGGRLAGRREERVRYILQRDANIDNRAANKNPGSGIGQQLSDEFLFGVQFEAL